MEPKTGRFAIIEQFLKDNISYIFGNPGTVEQGFLDAISSYEEIEYIFTLQETIAVGIADGYARISKKPTIVQLHTGVGLGNGIGMLYQAMRGHAPLIVLAGTSGTEYDAMDAQMAADLVGMAKPVTKWCTKVTHFESLLRIIRRAIKIASTPPMGPVFVEIPMDILDTPILEEIVPSSKIITKTYPESDILNDIADMLLKASKPMIIMGDGIAVSGAENELEELSEIIGAEVWGADNSEANISATKPQYMGSLGHMFGKHSKTITSEADVVFISGTYVFPEVFPALEGVFGNNAKIIHIDHNAYEIAKNFPVDIAIQSDPKMSFKKLINIIKEKITDAQKEKVSNRLCNFASDKKHKLEEAIKMDNQKYRDCVVDVALFMKELASRLPDDAIIFDEALTTSPIFNRYFPPNKHGHFFQTRGGSLGVGIPGAIGIKIAKPDNTVLALTGDGGSMYTIQALWTAAHHNVAAKFIICNNHSYKLLKLNISEYWKEREIPEHNFPASFNINDPNIDFVGISESLGVPAIRVAKNEDIKPSIDKMLQHNGPFLLELLIPEETKGHKAGCKCGQ